MGYKGELHIYFSFKNTYQVLCIKDAFETRRSLGTYFYVSPYKTNILTPVPVVSRPVLKISS